MSTLPSLGMGCSSNATQKNEIGVQLWSVRNLMEQDFEKAIAQIASVGFDYVEGYGLNPTGILPGVITPNHYERVIKGAGMGIPSCHSSYLLADEAPIVVESASRLGVDWTIIAWLSEELRGDYYAIAENLNKVGEQFRAAGIGFGYHNHDFEFFETSEGEIPMEILIENTEPELVSFQSDLYWVKKAGFDPLGFIRKYPGRFCSYHIKDANEALDQTDIGTGIVDFESILKENDVSGVEYVFVEDERTDTPLENVKKGYEYLKSLDF